MPNPTWFEKELAEERRQRSTRQMTLGKLIDLLGPIAAKSPNAPVVGLGHLESYRGYYDDLAFAPSDEPRTVGDLLGSCRSALGATFTGYKGGCFEMGEDTPLWVSPWGECSQQMLVGMVDLGGVLRPVTREADDA